MDTSPTLLTQGKVCPLPQVARGVCGEQGEGHLSPANNIIWQMGGRKNHDCILGLSHPTSTSIDRVSSTVDSGSTFLSVAAGKRRVSSFASYRQQGQGGRESFPCPHYYTADKGGSTGHAPLSPSGIAHPCPLLQGQL